jgi:uracil phosphoribosyltransferase
MNNFFEIAHPLVKHKLSLLRDKNLSKKAFKELVDEITLFIGYEATKSLPLTRKTIKTPLVNFEGPCLAGKKPVVLPILRAGIGMVDGLLQLMPSARVGHIGLYRNEDTLAPVLYYFKIPTNSEDRHFFVCDPMLATGGSAVETINQLKKRHVQKITFICLVAAPEGVANLHKHHPEVDIYAANLDDKLNDQGYILPGLGDAGDRMFGTK